MQTVSPLPRDALRGNPLPWMVSCWWAPITLWCWMLSRGLAQVRLYLIMSLSPSQPFGPVGKVALRKGYWQPPEHRLSVFNSRLWSSSARAEPFTRDHLNLFSLMLIESYLMLSPEVWPGIRLTSWLTRWPPFVETTPLTFAVGRWRGKKAFSMFMHESELVWALPLPRNQILLAIDGVLQSGAGHQHVLLQTVLLSVGSVLQWTCFPLTSVQRCPSCLPI